MIPCSDAGSLLAVQRLEAQLHGLLGAASSADWLNGQLWMHKEHMARDQILTSEKTELTLLENELRSFKDDHE